MTPSSMHRAKSAGGSVAAIATGAGMVSSDGMDDSFINVHNGSAWQLKMPLQQPILNWAPADNF